jgi:sec-independent protein translocase protein TatA
MSPSPLQLLIVALIILVLFGASRLGEVGKGLGAGIRNFKKGIADDDESDDEPVAKQIDGVKAKATEAEKPAEDVAEKKEKA